MLTGELWMDGGGSGKRKKVEWKRVEGKVDLIEVADASDPVLWEYESCFQSGVEGFEVLEEKCVGAEVLRTLPKMTITKDLSTHLSVPNKATGSRDQ